MFQTLNGTVVLHLLWPLCGNRICAKISYRIWFRPGQELRHFGGDGRQLVLARVLGAVFLILAALVKSFPLPTTILALILYIVGNLVFFFVNPAALATSAVLGKVIITICLIASVHAAYAYEIGKPKEVEALDPIEVSDEEFEADRLNR